MAKLHRVLSIGGETAGFLIPIFRAFPGSNQELVQSINQANHVVSLDPIQIDQEVTTFLPGDYEVHIGGDALWLFRDQNGYIHVGTAQEIAEVGQGLLIGGLPEKFPMAAAEMAAFCANETEYPHVLIMAYNALAELSPIGAEVWRDMVVFLPLIRKDIFQDLKGFDLETTMPSAVSAITREGTTHIYVPVSLIRRTARLPSWEKMARIFDIKRYEVHMLRESQKATPDDSAAWSIFGSGSIGNYILSRSPFGMYRRNGLASADYTVAQGGTRSGLALGANSRRLAMALVPSDLHQARAVNMAGPSILFPDASKHVLHVRPIGFGTPRKDKPSLSAIRQALSNFNLIWVLANHRQHKANDHASSLVASYIVARYVRIAASGLITCLNLEAGAEVLDIIGREGRFGLCGTTRYSTSGTLDGSLLQVLYSMLCEDAYLHTARSIVVLWPYMVSTQPIFRQIPLGDHIYNVKVVCQPERGRNVDVVGFAIDVQLSKGDHRDFRDFCTSLLSGYKMEVHRSTGLDLFLNDIDTTKRKTRLQIIPISQSSDLFSALSRNESTKKTLIITNKSVSAAMRELAVSRNLGLIHYSELRNWMKRQFGRELLDGTDSTPSAEYEMI